MLCEVETAILNLGLQLPVTHKSVILTESSNWAREGDLTLMLIQDSGVLRLYQAFLNDWIRALRNATATGPGTCDPAMLRPLTSYFKPKKQQQPGAKKVNKQNPKRPKTHKMSEARKHQQGGKDQQERQLAQTSRRMARKKVMRKKQRKSFWSGVETLSITNTGILMCHTAVLE